MKSGVNCTAGVHERKMAPFAVMFVLKFIFVSASSRALGTSMFENLTEMNQNRNCLLQNNFPGIINNGEIGMT